MDVAFEFGMSPVLDLEEFVCCDTGLQVCAGQAANVDPDKCRARTNLDILWAGAKLRRVNVLVNCH